MSHVERPTGTGDRSGIRRSLHCQKLEADAHPDLLSLSLSFADIRQWFKDAGIVPEEIRTSVYDQFTMVKAQEGTAYPIEGGMIETLKPYSSAQKAYMMQISGIQNIKRELAELNPADTDRPVFVECLACHGGCVSGPCITNRKPGFSKRIDILKQSAFTDLAGKNAANRHCPAIRQSADTGARIYGNRNPQSPDRDRQIRG